MKRKLICWLPLLLLIGCSQPTYRTTSLTPDKRAELLLKELTLEEKVALMMDNSQAVERLGIKPYTGGTRRCTVWHVRIGYGFSATDRYGGLFLASNSI